MSELEREEQRRASCRLQEIKKQPPRNATRVPESDWKRERALMKKTGKVRPTSSVQ